SKCDSTIEGLPVYWIYDLGSMAASHTAVCALSTTHRSRFVKQAATMGISFATLIHPLARISKNSTLGEGSIISAGAIVGTRTTIGRHVIVNRGALIGHHDSIGDYVSIMPGANIAGACSIGASTYIGMGAIVLDHIAIGSNSVIGAGAVVTRAIPDGVQAMGIPARIVAHDIDGK
ncbi:MAG: hypothetical protein ABIZ36_11225, partial [Gemmatimonadaceae bacterium]